MTDSLTKPVAIDMLRKVIEKAFGGNIKIGSGFYK